MMTLYAPSDQELQETKVARVHEILSVLSSQLLSSSDWVLRVERADYSFDNGHGIVQSEPLDEKTYTFVIRGAGPDGMEGPG